MGLVSVRHTVETVKCWKKTKLKTQMCRSDNIKSIICVMKWSDCRLWQESCLHWRCWWLSLLTMGCIHYHHQPRFLWRACGPMAKGHDPGRIKPVSSLRPEIRKPPSHGRRETADIARLHTLTALRRNSASLWAWKNGTNHSEQDAKTTILDFMGVWEEIHDVTYSIRKIFTPSSCVREITPYNATNYVKCWLFLFTWFSETFPAFCVFFTQKLDWMDAQPMAITNLMTNLQTMHERNRPNRREEQNGRDNVPGKLMFHFSCHFPCVSRTNGSWVLHFQVFQEVWQLWNS